MTDVCIALKALWQPAGAPLAPPLHGAKNENKPEKEDDPKIPLFFYYRITFCIISVLLVTHSKNASSFFTQKERKRQCK